MSQNSRLLEAYLFFILIVKMLFVFFLILKIQASRKGDKEKEEKYNNYQQKLHKLFTGSMGILLIILFLPRNKGEVCVDGHTKLFLFIFGVLSIITLMEDFFHKKEETTILKQLLKKIKNQFKKI